MKKTNYLNFVNQHIYVGIDVHAKRWVVSIVVESVLFGPISQDPEVRILVNYLKKNFPGGIYHCVYEAGFCGFWIHDQLRENGLDCTVVNPSDIPTTHKEKDRKTDKRDSRKMAKCLSRGELEAIYVHDNQTYEERSIIRTREALVKEQTRCKNRIKGLMKFFGIEITDEDIKTHWSNKFIKYLENLETEFSWSKISLNTYLEQLKYYRKLISDITKQIRKLSQTERYSNNVNVLRTIPGISILTAMILLTEIGNIQRFRRIDDLCGYIGLVPSEHSTGDKQKRNRMTKRGKSILKKVIVESSWTAIRKDSGLLMSFNNLSKRMKKTRAIISISRKLVSRIMYVLKNNEEYKFIAIH